MRVILAKAVLVFILAIGVSLDMSNRSQAQTSNSPEPISPPDHSWIEASNQYTQMLLAVEFKHRPEFASREGLSDFDSKISQPTWSDVDERRHETEAVLKKLKAAIGTEARPQVRQDLEIMIRRVELGFKAEDFERAHEVPFLNASQRVFEGIQFLLDEQTPAERRPAALERLRKYAGLEASYKPITEILKRRALEQMVKPGVIYPWRNEIETELGRDSNYVEGIAALCQKYKLQS